MLTPARKMMAVVVCAGVACGAVLGLTSMASSQSPSTTPSTSTAPTGPDVFKRFAVLRDASGRADGPAAARARAVLKTSFPDLTDAEAAQATTVSARDTTGAEVLVTGSEKGVCLVVRDAVNHAGGGGCTDAVDAVDPAKPLVSTDYLGDGRSRVTALLVDGISSLTISNAAGTTTLPVTGNVALDTIPSGPSTLQWVTPDGSQHRLVVTGS